MGYCIRIRDADFRIDAANVPAALAALKALGTGQHDHRARGREYQGGRRTDRWYSWMNGEDADSWHTLADAMEAWRYPPTFDQDGNVVGITFVGEKLGDEVIAFGALAPFVADSSWLEVQGEDGDRWRWVFRDGQVVEQRPTVSWD